MIRYEFIDSDVSDANIHPKDVFNKERDLAFRFIQEKNLKGIAHNFLFKRYNIPYVFDINKNLIASIDVQPDILEEYFYNSPLSKLRSSEEYQSNVRRLRTHIWEGYVEWIEGRCFRYLKNQDNIKVLDVGSRNVGWVEELQSSKVLKNLHIYKSLPPIKSDGDISSDYDVIVAFNVIQKEQKPEIFLKDIYSRLSVEGIAVLSFRSGTGFDVLALQQANKSIFPLDHLFLPSVTGMRKLLENVGFEVVEITTPGQLDAEIVKNAVENGECSDPLLNHLVETVPLDEIQTFIQKNNLSSHVRVVVKKK